MDKNFNRLKKISVIVAVYNIEQYIGRCIESIMNQSYSELQIILVDDGSTDESGRICDNYAIKDSRIRVIHQENQGLSEARNKGIQYAEGEWLSFIDGDDFVQPQFLEFLYEAAVNSVCEIAVCDYQKVQEKECVQYCYTKKYNYMELSSYQMLQNWHGRRTKIETVVWNKLYHVSLFQSGIRYPRGKLHEDVYTTHLLVAKANKIVIVNAKLYMYLQRGDSIVGTQVTENRIYQSIEAQEERIRFFTKQQYPKAYRNLKKGIIKHSIYFYLKTYSNTQIAREHKKGLRAYLVNIFKKYFVS